MYDAIGKDDSVAISDLVVLFDDEFLIVFKLGSDELLRSEEVDDVVVVGLLHGAVDLGSSERLVTLDEDLTDACFFVFIDIDSNLDVPRFVRVIVLIDNDFGMIEAFFFEVFGDDFLGTVGQVVRHLSALFDTDFDFDLLLFGFA